MCSLKTILFFYIFELCLNFNIFVFENIKIIYLKIPIFLYLKILIFPMFGFKIFYFIDLDAIYSTVKVSLPEFVLRAIYDAFGDIDDSCNFLTFYLTSANLNQLIRKLRIERSKELLLKSNFSISEICYNVGFSSPSYFFMC